jgi:hypothetical protein
MAKRMVPWVWRARVGPFTNCWTSRGFMELPGLGVERPRHTSRSDDVEKPVDGASGLL